MLSLMQIVFVRERLKERRQKVVFSCVRSRGKLGVLESQGQSGLKTSFDRFLDRISCEFKNEKFYRRFVADRGRFKEHLSSI